MVAVASAGSYLRWVRIMYERQVQAVATITRLGGQAGAKPRPGRVLPWLIGAKSTTTCSWSTSAGAAGTSPGSAMCWRSFPPSIRWKFPSIPCATRTLPACRGLAKLRVLDLNATEVTDECFKDLDGFPSLEILEVAVPRATPPQITDRGLGNLPVMPKLSCLFLMFQI